MNNDRSLRNKIIYEFVAGLPQDDHVQYQAAGGHENLESNLSPELAADFENGLESEIADLCGCGCGQSCSGGSGAGLMAECGGCHHHD